MFLWMPPRKGTKRSFSPTEMLFLMSPFPVWSLLGPDLDAAIENGTRGPSQPKNSFYTCKETRQWKSVTIAKIFHRIWKSKSGFVNLERFVWGWKVVSLTYTHMQILLVTWRIKIHQLRDINRLFCSTKLSNILSCKIHSLSIRKMY